MDNYSNSRSNLSPRIYILTRTSCRPGFFAENCSSVQNQSHKNLIHLISYDDPDTKKYVETYRNSHKNVIAQSVQREPVRGDGHFPFNLYLNTLMDQIKSRNLDPGWIMILDDDDVFVDNNSLSRIVDTISERNVTSDKLVLWQVGFPRGRIVPRRPYSKPYLGAVSCIGFSFHTDIVDKVRWRDRKGGDFLMVQDLWEILKPVWIKEKLTKINYDSIRTTGSGHRNDKPPAKMI